MEWPQPAWLGPAPAPPRATRTRTELQSVAIHPQPDGTLPCRRARDEFPVASALHASDKAQWSRGPPRHRRLRNRSELQRRALSAHPTHVRRTHEQRKDSTALSQRNRAAKQPLPKTGDQARRAVAIDQYRTALDWFVDL